MKVGRSTSAAPALPGFDFWTHLAWAARADARDSDPRSIESQKTFLMWWLCIGRHEYGGHSVTPEQRQIAWEAVPCPQVASDATLPRVLVYLFVIRSDIPDHIGLARPGGFYRAFGWLFACGLADQGLQDIVGDDLRAWLSAVASEASTATPITRLQYFLHCYRGDLQAAFDLRTPVGCARLVEWGGTGMRAEGRFEFLLAAPSNLGLEACEPPRVRDPLVSGCHLVGYAYGELGIGEDVRMMAASCAASALPFAIEDFSAGIESRSEDRSVAAHVGVGRFNTAILCLTGFDTARYRLERGDALLRGRYVIGYWPWELPDWPALCDGVFDLVDEIWVSSRFTQQAFVRRSPVPVLHMPMAVELPVPAALDRAAFGLPPDRFLFLYVFDANSSLARKNPDAAIEAFRRAFPRGDEPVGLVLKVMNPRATPSFEALLQRVRADSRILLIGGTLDRAQVIALMALCDAYVSLHRAEGFGRTIAEAMLLEKPVVATGWSGSDELVTPQTALPVGCRLVSIAAGDYPWGQGQVWAEPDLDQAALCLRALATDEALGRRLAAAGRRHVLDQHSAPGAGARYRRRLMDLGLL